LCALTLPVSAQELPQFDLEFRAGLDVRTRDAIYEPEESPARFEADERRTRVGFQVDRAHLNVRGELPEGLRFRLRLRLDESFDSSGRSDGTSAGLEYWYVEQSLQEGLDYKLGKQFVMQGGREGLRNGLDVYRYSVQGERIQRMYEVGVGVVQEFQLPGNERPQFGVLQLLNQPTGNEDGEQNLSVNAAWYGNLANDRLQPVLQFGFFPRKSSISGASPDCGDLSCMLPEQILSAGARVDLDPLALDLDIIYGEYYGEYGAVEVGREVSTLVVEVAQSRAAEPVRTPLPFVKWTFDVLSHDEQISVGRLESRNEIQLGLEYFPTPNPNYRLHAVGRFNATEVDGATFTEYGLNSGLSARF
jgi:hypothetical protein